MKKITTFITFFVLFTLSAFADVEYDALCDLYNRTNVNKNKPYSIIDFLSELKGDTITFNFPTANSLEMFSKEVPDTIWIKKRPKKNPREGKHYRLSFSYKGELTSSGEYITPSANVNGKPFGVLSVDEVKDNHNPSYSYKDKYKDKYILIKLLDLDDLSIVNCIIPHDDKFRFTISSNKMDREIKSIIGKEFYLTSGNGFSRSDLILCTLQKGKYSCLFDGDSGNMKVCFDLDLHFIDKDGMEVTLQKDRTDFRYPFISKEYYEDKYAIRKIDSKVDSNLLQSETSVPFDFEYILGSPTEVSSIISQSIDPQKVSGSFWGGYDPQVALEGATMFVGGSLTVNKTKFLKMIYNRKAFFMKAADVRLSQEEKAKLDTLENSSNGVQKVFWNKTLLLNQTMYNKRLEDISKEIESCSKHGLALMGWYVYDESEYMDGTGMGIVFFNPTDQVIKYVSVTFQGYNAVDDPHGQPITERCIGPIEPDAMAKYNFDYAWFSDVVRYAKIRSIVVTFKNGKTKTISNPSSIMLSDDAVRKIVYSNSIGNFE